jgi:hypothetical protein
MSAQKIGDIVKLIQTIAGRPISWRSTPPSKRRAPASPGRGFAVVASEVKSLAVQTAKATEAIVGQILAVQGSTASAVESIHRITQRMQEIQHYTSGVAASIEQQSAATGNISQNVATAAQATQTVAEVLSDVAGAAAQTDIGARSCSIRRNRWNQPSPIYASTSRHSSPASRRNPHLALRGRVYDCELGSLPSAACAAARRAIGTRNGEHDT